VIEYKNLYIVSVRTIYSFLFPPRPNKTWLANINFNSPRPYKHRHWFCKSKHKSSRRFIGFS